MIALLAAGLWWGWTQIFDSTPKYKTATCGSYTALAGSADAISGGALTIASDLMDAGTDVDPKGGAQDAADFGDTIVSVCAGKPQGTRLVDVRPDVVAAFLASHPQDRP